MYAKEGANVVAVARSMDGLERLKNLVKGEAIQYIPISYTSNAFK